MSLIKGQAYLWDEILTELNAVSGPVFYLLHRRGTRTVLGACLDIAVNPRAPYEIWPGIGEHVSEWAEILDVQTEPFEVFVHETDGRHYYRGKFRRVDSTDNANEIALRLAQAPGRGPIHKIIFLQKIC
jgi:hypothetical protein